MSLEMWIESGGGGPKSPCEIFLIDPRGVERIEKFPRFHHEEHEWIATEIGKRKPSFIYCLPDIPGATPNYFLHAQLKAVGKIEQRTEVDLFHRLIEKLGSKEAAQKMMGFDFASAERRLGLGFGAWVQKNACHWNKE